MLDVKEKDQALPDYHKDDENMDLNVNNAIVKKMNVRWIWQPLPQPKLL